jgi:hypothetical protein
MPRRCGTRLLEAPIRQVFGKSLMAGTSFLIVLARPAINGGNSYRSQIAPKKARFKPTGGTFICHGIDAAQHEVLSSSAFCWPEHLVSIGNQFRGDGARL